MASIMMVEDKIWVILPFFLRENVSPLVQCTAFLTRRLGHEFNKHRLHVVSNSKIRSLVLRTSLICDVIVASR